VLHEGWEYLVEKETYQGSSWVLVYMEKIKGNDVRDIVNNEHG
jgi:hypothetical protein